MLYYSTRVERLVWPIHVDLPRLTRYCNAPLNLELRRRFLFPTFVVPLFDGNSALDQQARVHVFEVCHPHALRILDRLIHNGFKRGGFAAPDVRAVSVPEYFLGFISNLKKRNLQAHRSKIQRFVFHSSIIYPIREKVNEHVCSLSDTDIQCRCPAMSHELQCAFSTRTSPQVSYTVVQCARSCNQRSFRSPFH